MTSSLAAVGKKGNVFFLNEIASKFCVPVETLCNLQCGLWTILQEPQWWGRWRDPTAHSLLMVEVGVGERRGETERNVLPTYDGCVSVTGGAPRCLGTATTGRGVWGGEQCLPVSNLLFMLVAGWRRAGPSPSFLAVTAAQPGQCVTKLLPTPTATVAGELCARELNDSSGVGLE